MAMDRPLSECIIVAFFRPSTIRELPTQAMCDAWPESKLHNLVPKGPVPLSDGIALYALDPKDENDFVIKFGINSMSMSASGPAYRDWPTFKSSAVANLDRMKTIYTNGVQFGPLLLQYVDFFPANKAGLLSVANAFASNPVEEFSLMYTRRAEIGGRVSTTRVEYTQVEDENGDRGIVAAFSVDAEIPRVHEYVDAWLDAAHTASKKLFWDALTEEGRRHPILFTDVERDVFGSLNDGVLPGGSRNV